MNLTTRQLHAFLTLAQLRNFTRAAATCHLSQPAFSATIRALEQAVGTRLFHRSTRNVELTAEGRLFEDSARRALQEIESGIAGVRDNVGRRTGRASIAVLPTLAAGWLPPVLAEFHARHPGIELHVADALSVPGVDAVRSGRADFGIVTIAVDDAELMSTPFCTDRFELVCRRDHRLADSAKLSLADLAGERFIFQVRRSIAGSFIETALHLPRPLSFMEVEQMPTVIGMVRAGLGIAAIPQFSLYDFHYPDLIRRELPFRGLVRRTYLVRARATPLSIAAQALHDLMWSRRPGAVKSRAPRRAPRHAA
ncbi:MAG: LysR family transcriptional regulator [Lautropia sp.]